MSTTITTTAANAAPMAWKARIESHAISAKVAIETNDFTFFHILRANDHINNIDKTALFFKAATPAVADPAKTDLDNINTATVSSLNNGFNDFKTDTERLKDDKNPDKSSWNARIRANGEAL